MDFLKVLDGEAAKVGLVLLNALDGEAVAEEPDAAFFALAGDDVGASSFDDSAFTGHWC